MVYIAIVLQLVFGFLIGFGGTWSVDLETFREIFLFSIGSVLGVWGVGSIFKEIEGGSSFRKHLVRLLNSMMGSSFGALLVIQINTIDATDDFVLPLFGALIGYYFSNLFAQKPE